MKKTLLLLVAIISLASCEFKKGNSLEKKETKSDIEISSKIPEITEQTNEEKERKFILEIYSQFKEEFSKCDQNIVAASDFNGKKGKKIIIINSQEDSLLFEEIYFEKNGELIYALESSMYMPINHFATSPWVCEFYFRGGKLLYYESLGHGKTETDEWEPESIFEMFKNRLAELKNISKEID